MRRDSVRPERPSNVVYKIVADRAARSRPQPITAAERYEAIRRRVAALTASMLPFYSYISPTDSKFYTEVKTALASIFVPAVEWVCSPRPDRDRAMLLRTRALLVMRVVPPTRASTFS